MEKIGYKKKKPRLIQARGLQPEIGEVTGKTENKQLSSQQTLPDRQNRQV